MQSERRVNVAPFPDSTRIGAMRPGRGAGVPTTAVGLVEVIGHVDAHSAYIGCAGVRSACSQTYEHDAEDDQPINDLKTRRPLVGDWS